MQWRRGVSVAALAILVGVGGAPTALAEPAGWTVPNPTIIGPAPSGPFGVGATTMLIHDQDRQDPWGADGGRRFPVTVTYPAEQSGPEPLSHYVSLEAANAASRASVLPVGMTDLLGLHTHARLGAPANGAARTLPVLIYSPGLGVPRNLGSTLVEDLASRGYVVVSVDHPGETMPAVEFPNGEIQTPRMPPASDLTSMRAFDARVADLHAVIESVDKITAGENPDVIGRALPANLAIALDGARIGVVGHSMGGAVGMELARQSPRVSAVVNLDGGPKYGPGASPAAVEGVRAPVLNLVSSDAFDEPSNRAKYWDPYLAGPHGWHRVWRLSDTAHYSFTDVQALYPEPLPAPPHTIGTAPRGEVVTTVRNLTAAMFDRFLRSHAIETLDSPATSYRLISVVR